ncbi:hypothetical protein B0H14DRAFT_3598949 [Mycena olivaceomarginata]|nr:hypothetical protein B0H14DRAFT_3598949 [Mycena olivaceomarginata]
MMLGALSLLPGSRYITLGLLSAALVIYTINRQRPSHKLARVECAIEVCEETLKYAKSNCVRNHLELTDATRRLLEAKLSASKIETQLLETHNVTTWEELVEYLQNLHEMVQNINQCAKDVKEIQRSTLVSIAYAGFTVGDTNEGFQLTIEAERQREFFEGIKELREIQDTVVSASAFHPFSVSLPLTKAAEWGEPSALPTRTNSLSTWRVRVLSISLSHHPFHHTIRVEASGLSTDLTPPTPKPKPTLTTPPRRHIHPPTNVKARTLAILHRCLVPRVADRWTAERVDEAAWCVSAAEASPCDSCNDSGDDEQLDIAGAAHAAKHAPPARPLGREGARPGSGAACGGEAGGALVVARAV